MKTLDIGSIFGSNSISIVNKIEQKLLFRKSSQIEFLDDFMALYKHVNVPIEVFRYMSTFGTTTTKKVIADIIRSIERGNTISDGMTHWFDRIFIDSVSLGQETGRLYEVTTLALDSEREIGDSIGKGFFSLLYPAGLHILISIFIVAVNNTLIIPALAYSNSPESKLTSAQQYIHSYAGFIEEYWAVIPIVLASVFVFTPILLKNYIGPLRVQLDQLPLFTQYRLYLGADFMRNYSIMKRIGLADLQIIRSLSRGKSLYYRSHLERMQRKIGGGNLNIVDAIDTGLISRQNTARLRLLSQYNDDYGIVLATASKNVVASTSKTVKKFINILFYTGLLFFGYTLVQMVMGIMDMNKLISTTGV
jgi:type II secretory pathway component PulF